MKIFFSVHEDTNKFILHSLGLELNFTSLVFESLSDASNFPATSAVTPAEDEQTNLLELTLQEQGRTFKSGHNYSFTIDYIGYPKNNNVGFYRSSYLDSDGVRK